MSIRFYPVTHVIFDCDGLLIDSEQYYTLALTEVCSKHGKDFNFSIKTEMMGAKPIEGAITCLTRLGLSGQVSPEDFVKDYERVLDSYRGKIKLMPGAQRLIKYFKQNDIPMAIATGSTRWGFERKTSHIGDLLRSPTFSHHVYAGSDPEVERGKPQPDVFLVAARRFRRAPKCMKNVLVFEDAINGVKAALGAGMQVALVPEKWTDIESSELKPTLVLKSLEQFDPQQFGLPPFTGTARNSSNAPVH